MGICYYFAPQEVNLAKPLPGIEPQAGIAATVPPAFDPHRA